MQSLLAEENIIDLFSRINYKANTKPISSHGRNVIVIPTTNSTISSVTNAINKGIINSAVGNHIGKFQSPPEFLNAIDEFNPLSKMLAVIFTDQLVSPIDAQLLVSSSNKLRFISGLEVALNHKYSFNLHVWQKRGFIHIAPKESEKSILQAINHHINQCYPLEDIWLARKLQTKRLPETRRSEAKIRLRTFCSSAMHMALTHPETCRDQIFTSIKIAMDMQANLIVKQEAIKGAD